MEKLLSKIKEIVYDCGKILLNADYDNLDIESKDGNNNIVTKYDKLVQEELKRRLNELLPEAKFIGEENDEYGKDGINSGYVYIVDPIDGTTNFSRRINMSSISVALLYNNEVIIGVCYNPYSNELFEASKGNGAYLNNKPIHVSNKNLKNGIVLCGCAPYYDDLRKESLEIQRKLVMEASDYRRFGSAVIELCSIASGKAEVYFELKLMPWDYAAASLILNEAGGIATTIDGNPLQYKTPTSIFASNGKENYFKYIK